MATVTTTTRTTSRDAAPKIAHEGPNYYRGAQVIIADEIELGADLATAARLTFDRDELPLALATDPAGVFARFNYGRSIDQHGEIVLRPGREWDELPVGNSDILTPTDPAWPAFLATVKRFSLRFDYPGRTDKHGWSTSNWGAARALFSMGYAVAESLAAFALAGAKTDDCIHYNLAESWIMTAAAARSTTAKATRRSQARARRRAR